MIMLRPTISSHLAINMLGKVPIADSESGLGTGEWDVGGEVEVVSPLLGGSLGLAGGVISIGDPPDIVYNDPYTLRASWMRVIPRSRLLGVLDVRWASSILDGVDGPLQFGIGVGGMRSNGSFWLARLEVGLTRSAPALGMSLSGSLAR